MPLRIMTQDFFMVGQVSEYESLQITSEWSGVGEIELHINRYMKNADKLQKGNIIFPHGRLDRAYVIEHREIALDEAGKITENWMIKAPSLKTWFSQKPTVPPAGKSHIELNTDAETVMHALVEASVINPSDSGMKIENLIAGTNQKRGDRIEWQSRYKVLSEELEKISQLSGIGWNIVVDRENERYIFQTYEGLDLTEHNGVNPPAIFSPEFKTIQNLGFVESQLEYKNYAIVAGQGEGADRRIVEVGDPSITGTDRRVLFVDARDVEEEDENGNALPVEEIERKLRERGEQKLAEHQQEVFLEGQASGTVVRKRDTSVVGDADDVTIDAGNYDKTVHLDPITLASIGTYTDSLFIWDVSTPSETEAHVEYSFDNRNWQPLGSTLPFTRNQKISGRLFIRIRLLTSNQSVTPSIRNFSYVINGYKVQGNPTLGRLTYGIDYDLGDMATLQSKDWGVSLDARITAVKEIYEPDKQAIELTFGNDRPTILTKIKQEMEGMKTEITR